MSDIVVMAERADAPPSNKVVPEVFSLNRGSVMGSLQNADKAADTDCANALVEFTWLLLSYPRGYFLARAPVVNHFLLQPISYSPSCLGCL